MKGKLIWVKIILVVFFLLGFASFSSAEFPERQIEILMPYGLSGGSAPVVRVIGEKMSVHLGKPVIIVAATGAGGTMAGEKIARRTKPDGYTLLQVSSGTNGMAFFTKKDLNYTNDDFSFMAQTHAAFLGLVAAPNAPFKTFEEFLAYAKQNPNAIKHASTGIGTGGHFFLEYLKLKLGLKIDFVPFRSPGEVTKAVVSGVCQTASVYGGSGGPNDELQRTVDGGARILALTSKDRLKAWPEIPTMTEKNIDLIWDGWWGIGGPKGMPKDVYSKIQNALYKALEDPIVEKVAVGSGYSFVFRKEPEFRKFVDDYYNVLEMIAKGANIPKQ